MKMIKLIKSILGIALISICTSSLHAQTMQDSSGNNRQSNYQMDDKKVQEDSMHKGYDNEQSSYQNQNGSRDTINRSNSGNMHPTHKTSNDSTYKNNSRNTNPASNKTISDSTNRNNYGNKSHKDTTTNHKSKMYLVPDSTIKKDN